MAQSEDNVPAWAKGLVHRLKRLVGGPGVERTERPPMPEVLTQDAVSQALAVTQGAPSNQPTLSREPLKESNDALVDKPDSPLATAEAEPDYSKSENPLIRDLMPRLRRAQRVDRTGMVPYMEGPRGTGPSEVLIVVDPTLSRPKPQPPTPPASEPPQPEP